MKKVWMIGALSLALLGTAAGAAAGALACREQAQESVAEAAVLRQGSTGGEVKEVQRRLKNWGYYFGSVDGIFGSQTKEAVKYFQRKNHRITWQKRNRKNNFICRPEP